MKSFIFCLGLLFSTLTSAAIIELPYMTNYSSGYGGQENFENGSNIASYLFEADFGVDKIYGFQLYIELDTETSILSGTSSLGYGINGNFLFNGSLYGGINLNDATPKFMRYSMYREINALSEYQFLDNAFFVTYAYDKAENTRFRFLDTKLFIATSPEDIFAPDTANAPYIAPGIGPDFDPIEEPELNPNDIPEPPINTLFALVAGFCGYSRYGKNS